MLFMLKEYVWLHMLQERFLDEVNGMIYKTYNLIILILIDTKFGTST